MKVIVAALGMLLLTTVPVLPAGFAQVMVPDPNGPPLEAGIWCPSDAPVSLHRLALYTQAVAVGGEVAGGAVYHSWLDRRLRRGGARGMGVLGYPWVVGSW